MSEKEKTNKKWTSSDKYRDNHDAIFGKNKYNLTAEEQTFVDSHTEDKLVRLLMAAGLSEDTAKAVVAVSYCEKREKAFQEMVDRTLKLQLYEFDSQAEWEESLRESLHEERLSKILEEKNAK